MKHYRFSQTAFAICFPLCALPAGAQISSTPLAISSSAPPTVLFDVSVEGPMSGPAYPDGFGYPQYDARKIYIGLFGEDYCYSYAGSGATGYFTPVANATARVCTSSRFSGNFLNWATMKAIDTFALTLTGGNRVVDSATQTIIQGARKGGWTDTRTGKSIPAGAADVSAGSYDIEYPDDYNFRFGSSGTRYNIRVEVCKTGYLQSNYCDNFGTTSVPIWKPKGLVQDNAEKMRFALTSYTKDDSPDRDGGVLRSLAKYVGPRKWDDAAKSFVANTQREWYPVGHASAGQQLVISDPDGVASGSGLKSGLINYINAFSDAGYKDLDPAGELFYEALNYIRKRAPTPEYSGADTSNGRSLSAISRNSSDARAGGHWFYNTKGEWDASDAIKYSCQKSFIVAINDANPWLDKRLPGTYFTADKTVGGSGGQWRGTSACMSGSNCDVVGRDYGQPSTSDTIDVTALTNAVGVAEGAIASGTWTQSATAYPGLPSMFQDSVGGTVVASGNGTYDQAWDDCSGRSVAGVKLGEVMGTCPGRPKQNSYYIAGLAHWANSNDMRPDLDGVQKVNTFVIDTQEPTGAPLDGPRNMLWLAAKYGGFVDQNKNGIPDLQDEWDKNGDSIPDNYMLASDPQRLKAGLTAAFANILALNDAYDSSSSAVAANSTRLDTGSIVYQMKYDPKDWTGQILAYGLNADGTPKTLTNGSPVSPPGWDSDVTLGKLNQGAAASRNVLTWNPDARSGADFKCSAARMNPTDTAIPDANCGLTNTQRGLLREAALPAGGQWDDVLNYLRGDPTNERGASPTAAQRFRYRNMTLGDIVNSDPLHIGDEDLGYESLPVADGGEEVYAAYRFSTETRRKVLYVGANDGMFHGFDALTGAEIFSFVPNLVITGGMKDLAQPGYTHRFFVDGGPTFGDVAKNTGTTSAPAWQWKTYVASNMAAGGRGVFLLDVSDPNAMGKTKVTWEFGPTSDTASNSRSGEIGNVMSQVKLVRLQNKRWAVIFGNGPNGASKTAKLFVVYVDANLSDGWTLGSDYLVFDTDTDNGAAIGGNGLGGISVVGDDYLTATAVYAGDLQGRLWKFDLTTVPSTCTSGVCGTGTKLFTTKTTDDDSATVWQPITSAPTVGKNSKCGYMVYFGTGRYYAQGDPVTTGMQTMYAIWDQPGGTTNLTASSLYEYQIDQQGTEADGTEWRIVKDNNTTKLPDLYAPASTSGNPDVCKTSGGPDAPKKRGWFLDLNVQNPLIKNNGERIVTPVLLRHGRVIFTTLEPSREFCVGGGKSWIMETKAEQGGPLDYSVFDINKDGSFAGTWNSSTSTCTGGDCVGSSGNKAPASGISTGLKGIIKSPTVLSAGGVEYKVASGSSKGELVVIKEKGSGNPRASWRQLR